MFYFYFSYREQMAKEMSEILSRLVQCNLGEIKHSSHNHTLILLLVIWTRTCYVAILFFLGFLYKKCHSVYSIAMQEKIKSDVS